MGFRLTNIPLLTIEQALKIEQLLCSRYAFQMVQFIENAAARTTELAGYYLDQQLHRKKIVVVCGKGIRGAQGLAAARHLWQTGSSVQVILTGEIYTEFSNDQLEILKNYPVPLFTLNDFETINELSKPNLVIDCSTCWRKSYEINHILSAVYRLLNSWDSPVIYLDLPAPGFENEKPVIDLQIKSAFTLALGLPLVKLFEEKIVANAGKIFLGDAGIPRFVYREVGIEVNRLFNFSKLIDLDTNEQIKNIKQTPQFFLERKIGDEINKIPGKNCSILE